MSAKGIKKINARYIIIFQESENARLWMPHKHTHPSLYVCLLVLPLVVRKFGFMVQNALKLKKIIELWFENSKTAKVEENGSNRVGNREFLTRKSRNNLLRGCALLSKLESSLQVESFTRSENVQLVVATNAK